MLVGSLIATDGEVICKLSLRGSALHSGTLNAGLFATKRASSFTTTGQQLTGVSSLKGSLETLENHYQQFIPRVAIPAAIYRSAQGPGPESAPQSGSAFGVLLGPYLGFSAKWPCRSAMWIFRPQFWGEFFDVNFGR